MNTSTSKTVYTIFVFISLAAFEHLVIGLFPPLFASISSDLRTSVASMGIISGANILATALSSIYWGYIANSSNRKKLILVGTFIWIASVYLTSTSHTFYQLLLYQLLTGIGLGSMGSIGFTLLIDSISHKYRGLILSLWGISQGFGGIAGAILASVIASHSNWRVPFQVLSYIGIVLLILFYFVENPPMGSREPELQKLIRSGKKYTYSVTTNQLKHLFLKGSNIYLFFQGFFMNITTGSMIWIPTFYIVKIQQEGINEKTAIITASILYAVFQLGGLSTSLFGYWGDILQRKNNKNRARFTALFVFITMLLTICFYSIPMNGLTLPNTTNVLVLLLAIGKEIVTNPWIFLLFFVSTLGSATQSANTPNYLALMTETNLPEHRGLVFSITNLGNSIGRTIGNMSISVLLGYILLYQTEVTSYTWTLSILQLAMIPSALCYLLMAKANATDIANVKSTLHKRAN